MDNVRSVPENTIQLRCIPNLWDKYFIQPLEAADASELLCLRQVSLRLPAEEAASMSRERWWRSTRQGMGTLPLQSFDEQQILPMGMPDDTHHSAGSAVRLKDCNITESIAWTGSTPEEIMADPATRA
jgi:hypothetical protein